MNKTILKTAVAAVFAAAALVGAAPTPASANPEFKLRYSDFGPPRGSRPETMMWWAEEINKRTDGRVEIEFFWSQALVKAKDTMKAIGSGLVETGTILGIYTPAELPVWNVSNTPFLFRDNWVGMRAMADIRKTRPEFDAEAEKNGIKVLVNFTTGPTQILMKGSPILSTADFKGKKIRASGGWATLLEKLGGTPINLGFAEIYQALDRGTIDGSMEYTVAIRAYKHDEVADHLTLSDMGQVLGYGAAISLRTWNKMPEDIRQTILEVSDEMHEKLAEKQIALEKDILEGLEAGTGAKKVQVHELPAEVRAEWEAAAGDFLEEWKADMAKAGIDGEGILADLVALREKYRAELEEKGYPWTR